MITVKFDADKRFAREMENLVQYSIGFLEGAENGKRAFLKKAGESVKDILSEFIDSNARLEPDTLHHVYEWYQVGGPNARLFDITYTVSNLGLSMKSNFTQSTSISQGSSEPFYDKAKMMEAGVSIQVSPRKSEFLAFDVDGQTIFTRGTVTIDNVGGAETTGSFEKTFDMFFDQFFSQSFLQDAGVRNQINKPLIYKKNLQSGLKVGKSAGLSAGYRWIVNVGAAAI